jgi:tRNA 5-methylaminomethyl-2-thiouridine biosynthesis bifunctional protein
MISKCIYDAIVIGSGIAGSTVAHALKMRGLKTALFDRGSLASGGTSVAGAWISPVVSKANKWNTFVNQGFTFSAEYYARHVPHLKHEKGTVRLKPAHVTEEQFQQWLDHAPSPHTRVEGGALLHRGFMLEPRETCRHLTRHVDDIFELTPVTHLTHRDGDWLVNEQYLTRHVILCTAHDTALVDQPWLKNYLRPVYGDVLEVSTSSHVPHTISGGTPNVFISPSSFLGNGHVLIGATHIQPNEQRQFDLHDTRLEELLSHAQTIHPLKDARIVSVRSGIRATTEDHYPLAGLCLDIERVLAKYGHKLKKGGRINDEELIYKSNFWLHTGLRGRGFTLAPLLSSLLAECIAENKRPWEVLPLQVSSNTALMNWARREDERERHLRRLHGTQG